MEHWIFWNGGLVLQANLFVLLFLLMVAVVMLILPLLFVLKELVIPVIFPVHEVVDDVYHRERLRRVCGRSKC